jgi:hypothetical protein
MRQAIWTRFTTVWCCHVAWPGCGAELATDSDGSDSILHQLIVAMRFQSARHT